MHPGSPVLLETIARLRDTGVVVRDVEFLPITAETGPDDWNPALETGALLGAGVLTVAGADADRSRLVDTLARLTVDAAQFGIRPALEAISYQVVSRVDDAAAIARATGAALMLDPLHIQRGGSSIDDVAALDPDLIPVLELCDAPLRLADDGPGSADARQYEARKNRLLIGDGALPLAALLAAAPAGTPVSLEIPNERLQAELSPTEFLARNAHAARELIAHVDGGQAADPGGTTDV
ncbi:TIM barrel protein [Microbacterium elymi]|uniref:TIM barrel protein n=1 Tax=Microbacterium elymi TaxID=2909587 RepID=A0ABY5NM04_9MICO|nr:TIM barrel protein [Microbacterium elymi]UUT36173.1 TIM barrel protein [Microbacterium elymi]